MNPVPAPVTGAKSGAMHGSIDSIVDHHVFAGWVVNHAHIFQGREIIVLIMCSGQEIGRGQPTYPRFDILKDGDYFTGFRVTCIRPVTDDDILFGRVHAEFQDCDGATAMGEIWDNVRARAANAILGSARPLGPLAGKLMLGYLARSGHVPGTDAAPTPTAAASPTRMPQTADEWLLNQFESLGCNCTFGVIQTQAKAAHLGLLQFSQITIDAVTIALTNRLAGVGEAEFTNISIDTNGEYRTSDRRYGMSAHTKINVGEVDEADFASRQLAKIRYLTRSFLEDIEAGDRILVVHAMPDRIAGSQLAALAAAVRTIGPAPILYVEAADPQNPPGRAVRLPDGVLLGYVIATPTQHFQTTAENLASWIAMCRQAYQLAFNIDDLDGHILRSLATISMPPAGANHG